jgi:hypothetical protein
VIERTCECEQFRVRPVVQLDTRVFAREGGDSRLGPGGIVCRPFARKKLQLTPHVGDVVPGEADLDVWNCEDKPWHGSGKGTAGEERTPSGPWAAPGETMRITASGGRGERQLHPGRSPSTDT